MNDLVLRWKENSGKPISRRVGRVLGHSVPNIMAKSRVRIWPFMIMGVAVLMILTTRLAQLSLVQGAYHREQADQNRVLGIRRAAARGIFLDRNGEALVRNVPIYKRQVPDTSLYAQKFEEIDRDTAVQLSQKSGERIFFDAKREYVCGEACSILLGYMAEVDEQTLANDGSYVLGDVHGVYGLEKIYEDILRGKHGSELLEVNANGSMVREIGSASSVKGVDLHLTIDMGLQETLYDALGDLRGAVVAQVPQTGEILAVVSKPSFDPNRVADFLSSPDQPFFNRAFGGVYPPGSTFKIVTAIAALEEGVVDSKFEIEDTGEIRIDDYRFGNWLWDQYGRTDGMVNMAKALQRSNDIYFYKIGEKLGPELIKEWGDILGYENTAGLEELGAAKGIIPDPKWKEATKGERWYLGNTYHMSIGQGDVLASPLQVNRMMGVVAANGVLCDPVLLKSEVGKKSCAQMNLQASTLEVIQQGLRMACEPGGTGAPFFRYPVPVACKTGTAEHTSKDHLPHAWFTAYAPANNPEIVLTVLVEEAGQGSEVAAPVAKAGMDYWFARQ